MRPLIQPDAADTAASVAATLARAPRRPRRAATRLFVPRSDFSRAVVYALLATVLAVPFYDTPWLAGGVFATVFLVMHGLPASRRIPWLPALIAMVASVQWVLAAWASYHLPDSPLGARMSLPADEYFAFAVPTLLAFVAGLLLPLRREGRTPVKVTGARMTPALRRACDVLLFGGLVSRLVIVPIAPDSIRGFAYMLGNLQYVGAFARLLAREPGWRWRVALVLLAEAYWDSLAAQYLEMVIWTAYTVTLMVHVHRVRPWKLVLGAVAGVVAIVVINTAKHAVRKDIQSNEAIAGDERAALAASYASDALARPDQLMSAATLTWNVARLNQGIITSRVLFWTPEHEPFAHGETVWKAVYASIVPRVLDPNKLVAGGFENYPRFTGLELLPGTSINLSIPGELYANFGKFGAVIGCFIYGMMLALLYRMFVRLSRRSPLWWAWAPFAMLSTVTAESGLGETLNQVSKSLLIMFAIVAFTPAWAQLRSRRARRKPVLPPGIPPAIAEPAA